MSENAELEPGRRRRKLAQKWLDKAKQYRNLHYLHAVRLQHLHYWLGIPSVILSAAVGTAVFASLDKEVSIAVRIPVGLMSIAAAVMSSLTTFVRFAERADDARRVANDYESIARDIDSLLTCDVVDDAGLQRVQARLDDIGLGAIIPHSVTQSFDQETES